jgi:hypothetical protein
MTWTETERSKATRQQVEDLTREHATAELRAADAQKAVVEHEEAVLRAHDGQFGVAGRLAPRPRCEH